MFIHVAVTIFYQVERLIVCRFKITDNDIFDTLTLFEIGTVGLLGD